MALDVHWRRKDLRHGRFRLLRLHIPARIHTIDGHLVSFLPEPSAIFTARSLVSGASGSCDFHGSNLFFLFAFYTRFL